MIGLPLSPTSNPIKGESQNTNYFIMVQITEFKEKQVKSGKTWKTEEVETSFVTEREHQLATSKQTRRFFKRLGGKEYTSKSYTPAGFVITRMISTSPSGIERIVRSYSFNWVE